MNQTLGFVKIYFKEVMLVDKKDYIMNNPTSSSFIVVDRKFDRTMEEVQAHFQSMLIIDKDSELFSTPLSPEIYDRIVASPNYRCLIDILEERVKGQQLGDSESKGMKI